MTKKKGAGWRRRRERLLGTKISKLKLGLSAPPLSHCISALYMELDRAGIRFHPQCYLSNGWGCPDLVPVIGIPFHLARADLSRLHREMGYDVEDKPTIMRLLRHETGHAINYAYRFYRRRTWRGVFGPFHQAYCDHYAPNPFSAAHVTYSKHYYAQKHPDEDFAEAFAVWLDPHIRWRKLYAGTPAINKILFVERLMRRAGPLVPPVRSGNKDIPVSDMNFTLADYYGGMPGSLRESSLEYLKQLLHKIFDSSRRNGGMRADIFLRSHASLLIDRISFWAGLDRKTVERIFHGFAGKAASLNLRLRRKNAERAIVDLASVLTFHVFTYVHTRKFPEPK